MVTRYVLDGWNTMKPTPIGNEHFDVIAELDGSNQLIARYLHGGGFDQTFARVDVGAANASERVMWYLTDQLNSVRLVLDESGAVLDQIAYDAFGNIIAQLNPLLINPILFASREFDFETGLYFNRARYLDPTTGRWTTQDPLGFAAGDANLYRYVGNVPTTFLAPSGLDRIDYRDNGAGQTLVWYVTERWFWRGDGPRQFIGVLVQVNGQSYVRRFVDGQAMFVPLHLVQGTTGFWADSVGNWDPWFRQNRQTDFSSTVASGWSQEFGVDLTGTVAELRRTGIDAYRDTYIIGPTLTVGMAVVPAGTRIATTRGGGTATAGISRGQWRTVNEAMSARARAYQQQITGRTGQSYIVNGVKFDGVNASGLIDAKEPGYATFVRNGQFHPWYRGADSLVDQARRQVAAANGTPITWHVAEADAATAMRNLLRQNNITGITVVHTPPLP